MSACAACRFHKRKCEEECVLAPYFPADERQKFDCINKVFGTSRVTKILNRLDASQREAAVKSIVYEAEARLRDPVRGCAGLVSKLLNRLQLVEAELLNARRLLDTVIAPQAILPMQQPLGMGSSIHYNIVPIMGNPPVHSHTGGQLVIREPQHQQQQHRHPDQMF
ncbi:LOB domain-containing protein 36-like [Carica papaya]|uniref:LOB domain-containing protein 36-like n=1 Tax=Carica papaya TaxID=3649 RepID=UPI000B8CD6FF|nr:LOB domain-containing protein 36-like [Carica papaya]